MGKENTQPQRHKMKTARVESQEDTSFPADGHQGVLNKMNTKSIKINHNRSTALERSVINH